MRVMELLWENGEMSAKELAAALAVTAGWSKTTTYTVIKKCVEKGAVTRTEPGFVCRAAVQKSEVQASEVSDLVDRLFGGAPDLLVSSLVGSGKLTREQLKNLRELLKEQEE